MTKPDMDLAGKTVAGYEVLELVGEGGMGAVYRGRQISLDREVAIKVLSSRLSGDDEFVQRFNREARSIAKVNHPNILQVYDVVSAEGLHIIAMEFVHGSNLTELLADRGFLPWEECADIIRQAALGLASAAKANIIHRDIKPDNLMLTADKVVKVSDFGLAKEVSSMSLTQTGDLMGTPAYMSPEQCDGEPLDTRTDIYSLGATFYRSATGMLPFTAATPVAMMYKQKHEALIPPREYMPDLPTAISEIIVRMMGKEPEDRFASMELVAESIERAMQGDPLLDLEETIRLHAEKAPRRKRNSARMVRDEFSFEKPAGAPPPAPAPPGQQVKSEQSFEELVELGERLMRQGRPVAACDCWRRALAMRPDADDLRKRLASTKKESTVASLKIGEGLLEQGKLGLVRAELEKQVQESPDDLDAREKLAALEFMDQKKRNAIREIRQMLGAQRHEDALAIWEDLPEPLQERALVPTMKNIKEHVLPGKRIGAEAQALSDEGLYEEAIAKWEEAVSLDPANDQLKMGRQNTVRARDRLEGGMREGYDYSVKRQFDLAIEAFDRVLAMAPDHPQAKRFRMEAYLELAREAEDSCDYGSALKRWREVLAADPGNHEAMGHVEQCTRNRNAVSAAEEAGKTALSAGRYSAAIRHWTRVLHLQPGNKTASFGITEARRRRFRYRLLPAALVLVLAAIGGVSIQYYRFINVLESGDLIYGNSGPERLELYEQAINRWQEAGRMSLFGAMQAGEIESRIRKAEVMREIDRESALYAAGDAAALLAHREVLQRLAQQNPEMFPGEKPATVLFEVEWHLADLLRKTDDPDYPRILSHYERAAMLADESGISQAFPREQGAYRQAIAKYLEARTVAAEAGLKPAAKRKAVIRLLEDSVEQWPAFEVAQTWLKEVRSEDDTVDQMLQQARKVLSSGREQSKLKTQWSEARQTYARAVQLADRILEMGESWSARKIKAEAEWRLQAGPDMIFFSYPLPDDPKQEIEFRAFALDQYEWPNRTGAMPQNSSYTEAVRTLGAVGKKLPTRLEWQWAAQGGEAQRLYPYGPAYDPAAGNTSSNKLRPNPIGWSTKSRSPEGVYDLAGNVAEWVDDQNRDDDEREQIVMGGHFMSGEDSRSTDWQSVDAALVDKKIGFRGALRWVLPRD